MPIFKYQHGDRPLDGYTIEHGVGRGGFGEVYYAVSDSGREVALKSVLNYEDIELRGIRQCMNLKSPHLVSIFDVRRNSRDEPFVIMEFVSGPSLRELLDENPNGLGAAKAAFFLREIAKGLSYLHDCGVVHRDLKPHNVFYEDGLVKIGDYSLSKSMSASHRSGHTVTVGTVHYMAPEISLGRYDKSVDIYALGVILYEMLTGKTPFNGDSVGEVLMKHVGGEIDLTGIDEPFAAVIQKSLAKDPNDRYASAEEMVADLFGAQHIQDSVLAFNPASLSMVAERVERKLQVRPRWEDAKDEPRPAADVPRKPPRRDKADEYVQAEVVSRHGAGFLHHITMAAAQFAAAIGFTTKGWRDYWGPVTDPIGRIPRAIMLLPGIALAGFLAAPFDHRGEFVPVALGATVIGIFSTMITQRVLLPRLERNSTFLYRIVLAGVYSILIGMWIPFCMEMARYDEELLFFFCLGPLVSLVLIDWRANTGPVRRSRFSLLRTIVATVLAGPGAPVAAGIAISSQLGSKFDPVASRRSCPELPWLTHLARAIDRGASFLFGVPVHVAKLVGTSVNRVAMGAPLSKEENSPYKRAWALGLSLIPPLAGLQRLYVGRIKSGLLYLCTLGLFGIGQLFDIIMIALGHFRDGTGRVVTAWNAADTPNPVGKAVNSLSNVVSDTDWSKVRIGAGNFALNFFGGIALIVTLIFGLFLAVDIPAAIASGTLTEMDLRPEEFEDAWGIRDWDRLLFNLVSTVAIGIAACSAATLMIARRQRSCAHIMRVPISGMLIFLSIVLLHSGFSGSFWLRTSRLATTPKIGPIVEHFLHSELIPMSLLALLVFAASLFVLAYPDKKIKAVKENEADDDNVVLPQASPAEASQPASL